MAILYKVVSELIQIREQMLKNYYKHLRLYTQFMKSIQMRKKLKEY
jgi:hypothetical protein